MVQGSGVAGRCGRSNPTPLSPGTAAARPEVVEILAGAVMELLLQRGPGPSPDEAPRLPKAPNSPISRQIRGVP